jgi:hypothetical protein
MPTPRLICYGCGEEMSEHAQALGFCTTCHSPYWGRSDQRPGAIRDPANVGLFACCVHCSPPHPEPPDAHVDPCPHGCEVGTDPK